MKHHYYDFTCYLIYSAFDCCYIIITIVTLLLLLMLVVLVEVITLKAEIVAGKRNCKSYKIFFATLKQKVVYIECCGESFLKKLCTLNIARGHF